MDTTLVDFNDMRWERGDISFIFNGEAPPSQSLVVLDNKMKVFQSIRYEVSVSFILFSYIISCTFCIMLMDVRCFVRICPDVNNGCYS